MIFKTNKMQIVNSLRGFTNAENNSIIPQLDKLRKQFQRSWKELPKFSEIEKFVAKYCIMSEI